MASSRPAENVDDILRESEDDALGELRELLSIPSVSTDPSRKPDVKAAADWVEARLRRAGVPDVHQVVDGGHPVVLGRWTVGQALPTILIYGHYDVQPEDPLELWDSPPFEPLIDRDRDTIFGRGAADMKGNLLTAIHGVEANALAHAGAPAVNVTFIFEGEEEVGSPSLARIVAAHRNFLAADAVLSADGGQFSADTPSQTVAMKGLASVQIDITAANSDLHSGRFGAYVANAARSAGELIASFHTAEGRVAVPGFYDAVVELTAAERAEAALTAQPDEDVLRSLDIDELWGEAGYTAQERQWARPTLDINGVWGGFQGEGSKTVTPAEAHIKVTMRLVPDQDPSEIVRLVKRHIDAHQPVGTRVSVRTSEIGAKPYLLDRSNPVFQAAGQTLETLYGVPPVILRAGGTIPATAIFLDALGIHTIGFAWSAPDSRSHAPNEQYPISAFLRGRRGYAHILDTLARTQAGVS